MQKLKFNRNGNWFITASRDQMIRLFDLRNLKEELITFRGHINEVCSIEWHPHQEKLFVSGSIDGSLKFWLSDNEKAVGSIDQAHDAHIFGLDWHPLGHVLCTGSNDYSAKFWTRYLAFGISFYKRIIN